MYSKKSGEDLQTILGQIERLSPKNQQEMIDQIEMALGDLIIDTNDSHNTKSVIFNISFRNKKYVMKVELNLGENAVKSEINWYLKIGRSFPNCPKYVASFFGKRLSVIVLSYLENCQTIDDLTLQSTITTNQTQKLIDKSLTKLNSLFENNTKSQVSLDHADSLYIRKFESRYKEALNYKSLGQLFSYENFYINGEKLSNFSAYISKIDRDEKLKRLLTPNIFGLIHGDLHCGNILAKKNKIYFVDPNGNLSMPIEYDYGKIFHSIHGGYGAIMAKKYKLKKITQNKFEFSVQKPQAYQHVFNKLTKMPSELFVRSLYSEAMHFATMLPHHASNENETTALFLSGILTFKNLFDILKLY